MRTTLVAALPSPQVRRIGAELELRYLPLLYIYLPLGSLETLTLTAMDVDRPLGRVLDALQDVQMAFSNFYRDGSEAVHALRLRARTELEALDTSLKQLDHLIQTLDRMDSWGAQLDIIHSILADLVLVPLSGTQISVADSIISDMNELKTRLLDIPRQIKIGGSSTSASQVFRRDLTSICGMIEGYRSMVNVICNVQMMCVNDIISAYMHT
jgi:hypothetical protein